MQGFASANKGSVPKRAGGGHRGKIAAKGEQKAGRPLWAGLRKFVCVLRVARIQLMLHHRPRVAFCAVPLYEQQRDFCSQPARRGCWLLRTRSHSWAIQCPRLSGDLGKAVFCFALCCFAFVTSAYGGQWPPTSIQLSFRISALRINLVTRSPSRTLRTTTWFCSQPARRGCWLLRTHRVLGQSNALG